MAAEPAVLARNTSYFTLALVAQKVISFLYFTFLARTLGPGLIGRYVLALSITTIFSTFLDLGLGAVLTREVARDSTLAERYVRLVFGFKALVSMVVVVAVVIVVHYLGYPALTRQLAYIACGVMVLDSFILTAYSAIRGLQTLTWESIGTVLVQLVVSATGFTVARLTHDVRFFMVALLFGATVHATYALSRLRAFGIRLIPTFDAAGWRQLFRLAWPFTLAAILIRVYGNLDTVLLSKLASDHAVGIYSVAYKVTFALQFIPSAFSASLFPGFSSYFRVAPEKLAHTFARGVLYLTSISLPLSIGAVLVAPRAIGLLFPAFTEAVVPLQVLMASLPFLFLTFPVGALLPACNRQGRNTLNIGVATAVSVLLNMVLIPRYGPLGAATASLVSTLVLLACGWVVAGQLVEYDRRFLATRLVRIIAAAALMGLLTWSLMYHAHILLAIGGGGVCYVAFLIAFRGVPWSEFVSLWHLLAHRQVPTQS